VDLLSSYEDSQALGILWSQEDAVFAEAKTAAPKERPKPPQNEEEDVSKGYDVRNPYLRAQVAINVLKSLSQVKGLTKLKLLKHMSIKAIRNLEAKGILVPDKSSGICYYSVVIPSMPGS